MSILEDFFVTTFQDRYTLICGLHSYEKIDDKSTDSAISGSGRPLPEYYTIDSIVYLCVSLNFIVIWLKSLTNHFPWRSFIYQYHMKVLF